MYRTEGVRDIVRHVDFKGSQKEELRNKLYKEYNKAITDREPSIRKCELWQAQANSRRRRADARLGDSNIDMPLTRKRMIQNSSRLTNPILQQEQIYVSKPREATERAEKLAREIEGALDFIVDQFNIREILDDWIEQFQIFPFGILKTPFVYEQERFVSWEEISALDYMELKEDSSIKVIRKEFDTGEKKYYAERDQTVDIRAGAFPEVIPYEDFIIPQGTSSVEEADVIHHRTWQTKSAVKRKIQDEIYDKKDGDQKTIDRIKEPAAQRERLLTPYADGKNMGYDDDETRFYEIVETYMQYDIADDDQEFEIIVTWEAKSKTILRVVHNFYQSYRRPFIVHQYKHVIASIEGNPLTYILEPLHVANSASFNQRLDAASLANETILLVPPGSGFKRALDRGEIRTGIYEANFQPGEIEQFTLSQPFNQLDTLEDKFEQSADEVSSLSPYNFGMEQSERPTMGGTAQLIEEAKQPQYGQLERFRAKMALLAKHMLSRYRQFYPEGLTYYIMQQDPEGREVLKKELLEWPPHIIEKDVIIETKVSSSTMSKMLRKQEVSAVVERMSQIIGEIMGLAQVATDVNNPAASIGFQLMNSYQEAVNRMMLEFDLVDKEKLNPELMNGAQFVQQFQQEIMRLQNELAKKDQILASITGGNPGGMPGGPGGPPQGGPRPPMG